MLKPFLLACDTKSPKLASLALVSLQKLLTRYAVADDTMLVVIKALEQVADLTRELLSAPYLASESAQ